MSLIKLVRAPFIAALLAVAGLAVSLPTPALAQAASAPEAAASPAEAAPPIATAPVATVSKEAVENPYGLEALWKGGDIVAKTVLFIMVVMSMGSWKTIPMPMHSAKRKSK